MKTTLINLVLFLNITLYSAQIKISGTVTFRSKGVKDVNVSLTNSYDGATTDINGNYSFITTEKGSHNLVFENPKFNTEAISIEILDSPLIVNMILKEQINEIERVVISAGAIEASDKKRATVLLSPIDIYTTAGADGQITKALNFLPGVQKVGESDGLFVRGGTGTETKIFMDGNLINNYFSSSVPGIAGRDRFNTSLFKGNVFSSGGYSALYGQALSGALTLESIDLPEQTSYDIGVSPLFVSGSYQNLNKAKTQSFGAQLAYSNLDLMQKLFNFNTDFTKSPQGFSSNFNYRIKTKNGGMLKYYGSYDTNTMAVLNPINDLTIDGIAFKMKGQNTFHNLSFKQKFGKYLLNLGASYSYDQTELNIKNYYQNNLLNEFPINSMGNYLNLKGVIETKIGRISSLRAGFETNLTSENKSINLFKYKDAISAGFAETDLGFSNHLSAKIGVRAEQSSFLNQWNIAPRLAIAYRLAPSWTTSIAYGTFYQNPESKYIYSPVNLSFQKAEHYIFQIQKAENDRILRFEAFYKNYENLLKTTGNQYAQFAESNTGNGFAKGIEFFWKDKKTFKDIDYWVSYSYLDTKRDFLNYPFSLTPNFAAKHTLNIVAKKFVTPWKTGFNLAYTFSSGRPYYDINNNSGQNQIRTEGRLKDYSALNFSVNYLPNLGKKDAKAFCVFVLSVSNILGNKNVFGYNFSSSGNASPILPPINTFVFVGAFISFGQDKTQEAINNNL